MKKLILTITTIVFLVVSCTNKRKGEPKVLVFSKTEGFVHSSIPAGITAIQKLGKENGFAVDTTKNAELFTDEYLEQFSAIVFLSTTGNILDATQEAAFERYIQAGGGFVGVHAATDTEYDWGWYKKLVGGQFLSHPSGTPKADFHIKNTNHPATDFFTDSIWSRTDELYNFKNLNPDVTVLMTVDEHTYEGGANGENHPMSWYHNYDGGRAFYTAAGHTDESFSEELFLKHLLGGIQYAIGENLNLDYTLAKTQYPPEQDRFSKVVLSRGQFYEPTEMTVLPNNDVLIGQRRGEVLLYKDADKSLTEVAKFDVYHKTLETPGVNAEEGLMGLQKDPNFEQNNWVYVYYAPTGDKWVNRLSRFKFVANIFDLESEQIILEVDSQREICCHTGGSIAFGPDNLLYLSTGDNSTPFNEDGAKYVNSGYAPLNDIPGKEQYDARRTSANTNDLRGKILRIKVNEDGSYSIPKGNLFPEGTAKTRPEIYTMGHRNPYRISVDPKNGYLYWGDVGPDARADSLATRGPKGYDEMNQARKPGNFGWPLFIGNNFAYREYDYTTGTSGEFFNPEEPINQSKNNTGLTKLPPAQAAYMYYPYADTPDFPQVASGGRNAMAGPTYYSDLYPNGGGLPSYYDGKVLIYDWMRNWMMALTLFEDGTPNKVEPFGSEIKLSNLIDMEMSPDGRVYLLEYGSGWFSANPDSGLSYIDFNGGNRPPVIDNMIVDKNSGSTPLTVTATVTAHDREADAISYKWDFGDGNTKETNAPTVTYAYKDSGAYKLMVTAIDANGEAVTSDALDVIAGNERPKVAITIEGANSSFYIPGKPFTYEVKVDDPDGAVDQENIYVSLDYRVGMDQANDNLGHQQVSGAVMGKALTTSLDCKSCHKEKEKSIGPSYLEVAQKYDGQRRAANYLMSRIIGGGSGVWGEVTMPAHPNLSEAEASQIVMYIQSLTGGENKKKSLPLKGNINPENRTGGEALVLTASYTDRGTAQALPLTGSKTIILNSNTVGFSENTETENLQYMQFNGMELLLMNNTSGYLKLPQVDLNGLSTAMIMAGWQEAPVIPFTFKMHLGSPNGTVVGTGKYEPSMGKGQGTAIVIPINYDQEKGVEDLYITYKAEGSELGTMALLNVQFN
ncbi:ThuA domain-containing protein [Croceivirga radicis]|uniref:ThuA domain-containing protein n=1 Tax=Croceivirga radicis TaxID=1929488 RepID=UPI000255AD9E|nr:ThuA domain-containing protein [Croceivirga radicis]